MLERLEEIEQGVSRTAVPLSYSDYAYNLRTHIEVIRTQVRRMSRSPPPAAGAPAREEAPVRRVVPAEPTAWAGPCLWYRDHQAKHRWTPSGWTCDACHPEEGHPA